MHKLKLPKVSRSEVTGSIKIITKWIYKGLFIVYCSFNFGKENSTITGKTIEGQPYAHKHRDSDIGDTYHIPQLSQQGLIENSHFNLKLVSRQC